MPCLATHSTVPAPWRCPGSYWCWFGAYWWEISMPGESPLACSSQHLLCTWCLPSSRGGREIVWIHQGGICDLPGIPHMGQSDWRFNCVLERVPTGYNCTIKMFPGPKGKWQGMAHIWIEEISIPKLAAVKSPWLVLSREPCQGGERTEISLEIL